MQTTLMSQSLPLAIAEATQAVTGALQLPCSLPCSDTSHSAVNERMVTHHQVGENSVTFESSNVQSQLLNILLQQSTSVLTTVRGTGSVCYLPSFSYAVKLKKEKCLLVHSQFPSKSWIWLHFGITWDRFLTENASSFLINPFRDPNSIQKLTLLM